MHTEWCECKCKWKSKSKWRWRFRWCANGNGKWKCMTRRDLASCNARSTFDSLRIASNWIRLDCLEQLGIKWERDDDDDDITSSSIDNGIDCWFAGAPTGGRNKCQDTFQQTNQSIFRQGRIERANERVSWTDRRRMKKEELNCKGLANWMI